MRVDNGPTGHRPADTRKSAMLIYTHGYVSTMDRMTFTVPEETRARAQARHDINWSAVVSAAIEERLLAAELADKFASDIRKLPLGERTLRRLRRDLALPPEERASAAAALSDALARR